MNKPIDIDVCFKLFRLLNVRLDLSQREIAREPNVSLRSANYILRALVDNGQAKISKFRASDNKIRYAYTLTPRGLEDKVWLTEGFLKRKRAEYQALPIEIEALPAEAELRADAASLPGIK